MAGKMGNSPKLDPKEEEQMMEFFTQQVMLLKEKAMLHTSVREEKKLLVENAKLKKDIDDLKKKLQDTKRRKATKLHQERVLTATVTAMKSALPESTPSPAPSSQTETPPHTHSEGGRRRRRRRKGHGKASESDHLAAATVPVPVPVPDISETTRVSEPDILHVDLRVGRIMCVTKHPDSESLYVKQVDMGEAAPRTVVSTLANHTPPEQLQDRLAVLLCNVRPVKVRGVQSQARLLCAVNQSQMELLAPPTSAVPGDRVTFQNYPGGSERDLTPRRGVWERLLPDLGTDARGVATYRGVAFQVKGKGLCRAPTISNGAIK